ncbi:NlpC/P60 family protein [Xinfangfangia sp. CPCC 101601]|uniref:NlpC/P60 family protein n=1 Tax=Pseudogemmobacter lacusdianii TaxID=3069608 RepID=A0ABU0VXI6_9RHOB|nr:NlpC/P60 family protein [Xinfangfangia sp. CPCC 101601]MDQ2066469.1 NlpC/P60 family protein [Xinfangfangia sp. CPCC 101601]
MDRRTTPFSGRIAHISLKGQIDAQLTEGEAASVAAPLANLLAKPGGALDRQVVYGEALTLIDRQDGHAYVMAAKDGYCGWLAEAAVGPSLTATHKVASPATHLYPTASAKAPALIPLYLGARVEITGVEGKWAQTQQGFIPLNHLAPLNHHAPDPVAVAEMFLHTPYFWGGNTAAGIDCSGLAQAALLAAGIPCPGDSDLQQKVGVEIPEDHPLQRGDLIFWKGHVALMTSPDQIIHANGGTMSVAYEGLQDALTRIEAQGEGSLVARRRPR